jgi:hypothetical protein
MHHRLDRLALLFVVASPLLAQTAPAPAVAATKVRPQVFGRLEDHGGLRVLRTWGTPAQRGYAHGFLLAAEIAAVARAEFTARFARQQPLLQQVRAMVPRLVAWPDDLRRELDALFDGLTEAGVDLQMPELERAFDRQDLLVANALDIFGLLGCSSFTVSGGQVAGGGVLTGRNFDWPFTGDHMLANTIVAVEHGAGGRAIASVTWPGYLGTVTGLSSDGVVVCLHVGSGKITMLPEPESWPTAVAARAILEQVTATTADPFGKAKELLGNTSPPAGFITRVALASPVAGAAAAVFEADSRKCLLAPAAAALVTTNHFQGRSDGRAASKDSTDRAQKIRAGIERCLAGSDHQLTTASGWELLQSVDRGGGHAFGTLHSLMVRPAPWYFELRIARHDAQKGIVPATRSDRRFVLARDELFPAELPAGK